MTATITYTDRRGLPNVQMGGVLVDVATLTVFRRLAGQ
jgi:hypothetical protein